MGVEEEGCEEGAGSEVGREAVVALLQREQETRWTMREYGTFS